MQLRPCIDIHNGQVKQIVGASLRDRGDEAVENFVSEHDAAFFADLYKKKSLYGGHVIMLNPASSPYYEVTRAQAMKALAAFPGGLQIGGGINPDNAGGFIEAGASHVIVTSYVFRDGDIDMDNLKKLTSSVGRRRVVLDVSAKLWEGRYMIVTDRWQKLTGIELDIPLLDRLGDFCDEFLVHGVDAEGRREGADGRLFSILSGYEGLPVTYAGGIRDMEDIEKARKAGRDRINITIGSALDIFGGDLSFDRVCEHYNELQKTGSLSQ